MAEALETLELVAALDDDRELTINDLPNDVLVSIFAAVGDLQFVRHNIPSVRQGWAELYRTQDASPLHETLEVDFRKEAREQRRGRRGRSRRTRSTRRSRRRSRRRRSGLCAPLSTPRASSHGPRGAPALCTSCSIRVRRSSRRLQLEGLGKAHHRHGAFSNRTLDRLGPRRAGLEAFSGNRCGTLSSPPAGYARSSSRAP